jgi:hypothetical protein
MMASSQAETSQTDIGWLRDAVDRMLRDLDGAHPGVRCHLLAARTQLEGAAACSELPSLKD